MTAQNIDFTDSSINIIPSFGNAQLRFGDSGGASFQPFALSGSTGSLSGAQYYDGANWKNATIVNQPFVVALGIGGSGWNGGNRYFSDYEPNSNNLTGTLYGSKSSTPFTINNNLSGGVGSFTWTGHYDLIGDGGAVVSLKVKRNYTLRNSWSFVKETTTITNID